MDIFPETSTADLKDYQENGEWDLVDFPCKRKIETYVCCPNPFTDVTCTLQIRRRTKYYWINLIIPCMLITGKGLKSCGYFPPSFKPSRDNTAPGHSRSVIVVDILVFHLSPVLSLLSFMVSTESGERITLVITNLLALTVFMLIVADILPPTSEVVPLISVYITCSITEVKRNHSCFIYLYSDIMLPPSWI